VYNMKIDTGIPSLYVIWIYLIFKALLFAKMQVTPSNQVPNH
jgi:hypothetical protein